METAMSPPSMKAAYEQRAEPAWPWDWENRPAKDECDHDWEIVVIQRLFNPKERVARCMVCHTPRCGYAEDVFPCQRRRHHTGSHNPYL